VTPLLFRKDGKEHMEKYDEIECVPVVSENIHTHPKEGWLLEIPGGGGGGLKSPSFLKESMALKWNFQRG